MKALITIAAALVLVGCSSPEAPRPGNPEAYAAIEASTDCEYLRGQFDFAYKAHEAQEAGSAGAITATSFMEAADKRMQEVGCY